MKTPLHTSKKIFAFQNVTVLFAFFFLFFSFSIFSQSSFFPPNSFEKFDVNLTTGEIQFELVIGSTDGDDNGIAGKANFFSFKIGDDEWVKAIQFAAHDDYCHAETDEDDLVDFSEVDYCSWKFPQDVDDEGIVVIFEKCEAASEISDIGHYWRECTEDGICADDTEILTIEWTFIIPIEAYGSMVSFKAAGNWEYDNGELISLNVQNQLNIPPAGKPIATFATKDDCEKISINIDQNAGEYDGQTTTYIERKDAAGTWQPTTITLVDGVAEDISPPYGEVEYRIYNIATIGSVDLQSDFSFITGKLPGQYVSVSSFTLTPVTGATQNGMRLNWDYTGSQEGKFEIIRENVTTGDISTKTHNIGELVTTGNSFEYFDDGIKSCTEYKYQVNVNSICGSNSGTVEGPEYIAPSIAATFDSDPLTCSKGFYTDYVLVDWSNANNPDIINEYKVYRKKLGEAEWDEREITQLRYWKDEDVLPGRYYQYKIEALGCVGSRAWSNEEIGFISARGKVTGSVKMEDGSAVQDVEVSASLDEFSDTKITKSLLFNANISTYLQSEVDLSSLSNFTVDMYTKMTSLTGSQTPGSLINGFVSLSTTNVQCGSASASYDFNEWHHWSFVKSGGTVKIFKDGELESTGSASAPSGCDLFKGFKGYATEIRIWDIARTASEIERDYRRLLSGTESNLIACYHVSEGIGSYTWDVSRIDEETWNENHAEIIGTDYTWEKNECPSIQQLYLSGFTNSNGYYEIASIPGTGEVYTIFPKLGAHDFTPRTRQVNIGFENGLVHNGFNFRDNSSFRVNGIVKYDDCDCFSEGVFVLVDYQYVMKDGMPVVTDKYGRFTVNVPIGEHRISVAKNNHGFKYDHFGDMIAMDTWPPDDGPYKDDPFDFDGSVEVNLEFIDTTRFIVAGRVVGGKTEGDKKIGFGKSINNVGVARIIVKSQNECYVDTLETNDATGEYEMQLPPQKYLVSVANKADAPFLGEYFKTLPIIDLGKNYPLQTEYDSVETTGDIFEYDYHLRNDYIYRVKPVLSITTKDGALITDGEEFNGEDKVKFVPNIPNPAPVNVDVSGLQYPVFQRHKQYKYKAFVFEEYEYVPFEGQSIPSTVTSNLITVVESGLTKYKDRVRVKHATLKIRNDLAMNTSEEVDLYDGEASLMFKGGFPNKSTNVYSPELDFAKKFEVTALVDKESAQWIKYGYVFGAKNRGTNFYTTGPDLVSMIIRDPPGSASQAYISKGEEFSMAINFGISAGYNSSLSKKVSAGVKFEAGSPFFSQETEVKADASSKTSTEISASWDNELGISTTVNETWTTNGGNVLVGALSDLFIGNAVNFTYGATDVVDLIHEDFWSDTEITVSGPAVTGPGGDQYKIGKTTGFFVVPKGFETKFIYSKDHVKNYLIPKIERLRNEFIGRRKVAPGDDYDALHWYKLVINNPTNNQYGLNNDDPGFGAAVTSTDPVKTDGVDDYGLGAITPPSYYFQPPSGYKGIDSIRNFNQQIRLWKEALAKNERDKLKALTATEKDNISFNGGNEIDYEKSVSKNYTTSIKFEVTISEEIAANIGAESGGVGVEVGTSLEMSMGVSGGTTINITETNTFGYKLYDDDEGDQFTVDIVDPEDGNGPIFLLKAGQTLCPWENELQVEFDQDNLGKTITPATVRREVTKLDILPGVQANVPQNEPAVFNVFLTNESESDEEMTYILRAPQKYNPDGAQIEINGVRLPDAMPFRIPPNESYKITMTVWPGPEKFDYEDLRLVFQSECEWSNYQNGGFIFASDTVSFDASFIPPCSNLEISVPDDRWIINQRDNDSKNIILSNFDATFPYLENLQFHYRPASSSRWILLDREWRIKEIKSNGDTIDFETKPTEDPYIDLRYTYAPYKWDVSQLPDGNYEIRPFTECGISQFEGSVFTGIIDRVPPHNFGNPKPSNGILRAGDDIMITYNEEIKGPVLTPANFDIRGVLNGSEVRHHTSLHFDGSSSYSVVNSGINLAYKSFTIEFWAKRDRTGIDETLLSQGADADESFYIGFNKADQFFMQFQKDLLISKYTNANDDNWHHWAIVFDNNEKLLTLYREGDIQAQMYVTEEFKGAGRFISGAPQLGELSHYQGNIHELRVWDKTRSAMDLSTNSLINLSGKEQGLIGYWPMNDGTGNYTQDKSQYRHAKLMNTTWDISPKSYSLGINETGNLTGYAQIKPPLAQFNPNTDFSIEFWFKAPPQPEACLFSNASLNPFNEIREIIYNNNYSKFSIALLNDAGMMDVDDRNEAAYEFELINRSYIDPSLLQNIIYEVNKSEEIKRIIQQINEYIKNKNAREMSIPQLNYCEVNNLIRENLPDYQEMILQFGSISNVSALQTFINAANNSIQTAEFNAVKYYAERATYFRSQGENRMMAAQLSGEQLLRAGIINIISANITAYKVAINAMNVDASIPVDELPDRSALQTLINLTNTSEKNLAFTQLQNFVATNQSEQITLELLEKLRLRDILYYKINDYRAILMAQTSINSIAQIQERIDAVNPDLTVLSSLEKINQAAITNDVDSVITIQLLSDAGVVSLLSKNLLLYKEKIRESDSFTNISQVQQIVNVINENAYDDGMWNVYNNEQGKLLLHHGNVELEIGENLFDDTWHHFSLVVNRHASTYVYIDGELANTGLSKDFGWFKGNTVNLGARVWYNDYSLMRDKFFKGRIDDLRIWNTARQQEQVDRYKNFRLDGTEPGLMYYFPFEYYGYSAGTAVLSESFEDMRVDPFPTVPPTVPIAISLNSAKIDQNETPPLKMDRPVEKVAYDWTYNNDKVIIVPKLEKSKYENCILDVTVEKVIDMQGNKMASPVTWSVFSNQNPVLWDVPQVKLVKNALEPLTFSTKIVNKGGSFENYTISNLPTWLKVSPSEGVIDPLSELEIEFEVNEGLNVGSYSENILLTTPFGYNEKFAVDIRVLGDVPQWEVNADNYQYSMSIVGRVFIADIPSTDEFDNVAAFVGDQCRGVTHIEYIEEYDSYIVYLNIYSNVPSGEDIILKVYDASKDFIYTNVAPKLEFKSNTYQGTTSKPIDIRSENSIVQRINFVKGWKWFSFNLTSNDLENVDKTLEPIDASNGDIVKNLINFDQYTNTTGWVGSLTNIGGFNNYSMYMMKLSKADTLDFVGQKIKADKLVFDIEPGWNWIGYAPRENMTVNEALVNYSAFEGDLLKSQKKFAIYDPVMGWMGSLRYMVPGEGYMLKSKFKTKFTNPERGLLLSKAAHKAKQEENDIEVPGWNLDFAKYPNNMSLIAKLVSTKNDFINQNYILGAFVNDECVGITEPVSNEATDNNMYFLTIYGDPINVSDINFKVYEKVKNEYYDVNEFMTFAPDSIVGAIEEPVLLTFDPQDIAYTSLFAAPSTNFKYTISPVPFTETVNVTLQIKEDGPISFEVYDMFGKKVMHKFKHLSLNGDQAIQFGKNLCAGTYLLKMNYQNKIYVAKITKLN